MMNDLYLLPQPRREERRPQALALQPDRLIWLDSAAPQRLRFAAQRFKQALFDRTQLTWLKKMSEGYRETVSAETLHETLAAIDQALVPLSATQSDRADAALLRREFELAARMLRHAARRGLYAIGVPDRSTAELDRDLRDIIEEYQHVWLKRNRPGGLRDSVARLEQSRRDYAV